jgi:nitroreductase
VDYDSFLELVKKRRSIKRFKPEPIPDEYVDKIIEAARWAPSGANSQPWEFIVVKKQELKDTISQFIKERNVLNYRMELTREPEQRFFKQASPPPRSGFEDAPVYIILCGDPRTENAYPLNAFLQRGEANFISGLASAFLYMHLAATTLGLASQWVATTTDHFVQSLIKDLLGVPKELEIYDMMAVGYPAAEPKPRPVRDKEEMVHYDYYDKTKFRTAEQVKDFIAALRRS